MIVAVPAISLNAQSAEGGQGNLVLSHQPAFWEDHPAAALALAMLLVLQSLTIIALLRSRHRRKQIEERLREYHTRLEEMVQQRIAELNDALAAAQLANRTKDEFLANLSHELRTPLNAVIGLSGLARDRTSDPKQRDYLDKIASAGQQLAKLINNQLDLSKIAVDLPEANPSPDKKAPPPCDRNVRVLVVEDQPINREIVGELLASAGIAVRMANHGQEALDILAETGPTGFDLILMDVQMPVMDGLAATKAIRALPGFNDLPIIAMSAHTMKHEIATSQAAGMNDHIGKPFDAAGFHRILAKWLPPDKQGQTLFPSEGE